MTQHLDIASLDTFATQLDDSNRDTIALRNSQGRNEYTYYHMDCNGPLAGRNANVYLDCLSPDCRCATCGGSIHKVPVIDA